MSNEWCIVDKDLTTILFDLDDNSGAGNPFGIRTAFGMGSAFNLGSPDPEFGQFNPSARPGGYIVYKRDPLVNSTWRQRFIGFDEKQVSDCVSYLGLLLGRGGIIKISPQFNTLVKYIYYEPSKSPALLEGKELELYFAWKRSGSSDTPQGIDLSIWRQPDIRSDVLVAAVNLQPSPMLLVSNAVPGVPDGYSWSNTTGITGQAIDETKEMYTAVMAVTGAKTFTGAPSATGTFAPGDFATVATDIMASDAVTAKALLLIDWMDASNAVIATVPTTPVFTQITPLKTRLTFTSPTAAPASTSKARMSVRFSNASATSVQVWMANWQLEKGQQATLFRVPSVQFSDDPAAARGHIVPLYIQGDYPTPVLLRVRGEASQKLSAVQFAKKSGQGIIGNRKLTDFLNTSHIIQCEAGTLGTDASLVADTTASPGSGNSAVKIDYATVTAMARRVRIALTVKLESLRGEHDLWLRMKAMGAAKHRIRAAVGLSNADPATFTLTADEQILDTTLASTFGWVRRKIGRLSVPGGPIVPAGSSAPTMAQITIEVWTARDSGSTDLRLDYIDPVPADDDSYACWVNTKTQGSESWTGPQMLTPTTSPASGTGTIYSLLMNLKNVNEAARTPSFAPLVGRQFFTVNISTRNPLADGTKVGEIRIRDLTSSTNAKVIDIMSKKDSVWENRNWTLAIDSTSGHSYEVQVWCTVASRTIDVYSVTHETVVVVGPSEYVSCDPDRFVVEHLDSTLNTIDYLACNGPTPMYMDPGLQLLFVATEEQPLVDYTDPEDVLARTPQIEITYAPRWRNP